MAKKPVSAGPLSFVEIVMRADAETIKAAYEARVKVDGFLAERDEAYRRIAELEAQVETVMGEPGVFIFPPPPYPVAGFGSGAKPAAKKPAAAPHKPAAPTPQKPATPVTTPGADTTKAKPNEPR
ncbi:MAG: hypothetical protein GX945_10430 [Lentisphaerae bacterium]|jgi:hypothetical protein|nr:hypothetical protein [Lentisphaerota bacterium]